MEYIDEIRSLGNQLSFHGVMDVPSEINKIVIAGMGGSGIAGMIFRDCYTKKPVTLVNSYNIPDFVDKNTLFVAISYSGNTSETLEATRRALKRGAQARAISTGGKLAEMVEKTVIVPGGFQPRSAVGFLTIPLFRGFGLVDDSEIDFTRKLLASLDVFVDPFREFADKIFSGKKIPVIFGTPGFDSVAYRWKTQFNENAKVLAYSTSFPELNHNDTMALESTYRKEEFYFFVLTHQSLEKEISDRIKITSKLCNIEMNRVDGEGASQFSNIFTLIHKGDFISYYLAERRGVDPRNVEIIEKLKRDLEKSV
jgi:glucose/mannose-6-phosphate isomerase